MDWTLYGYVIASEYRRRIILSLFDRPKSPKEISEETKLYLSHVSLTIYDLVKKGLVECLTPNLKKGKIFSLTTTGKEIAELLKTRGCSYDRQFSQKRDITS
jgi:predicted transcriptional regulator